MASVTRDNELDRVVIYADCCFRCRLSLYFMGILFYDLFARENVLDPRGNVLTPLSQDTRSNDLPAWPIFTFYGNHRDCTFTGSL